MTENSPFLEARRAYAPRIPAALADLGTLVAEPEPSGAAADRTIAGLFPLTAGQGLLKLVRRSAGGRHPERPLKVGVVLSGGPAPGGHNVLWGLLDGLSELCGTARLTGFLGGPGGILADKTRDLTKDLLDRYRNTGGFDVIGTGRAKLETEADFATARAVLERRELDTLVVIGGDDSNTNAAVLAEYLLAKGSKVRVVGVPKTIDGDLKNERIEASFGFDTAVKIYSELIANIARDTLSTRRYYHFVRLMGRSASHITLEAALATQPNLAIVSEEVAARGLTLRQLVAEIGGMIQARAENGKNFGIILVPEGLIEFLPEMKVLIREINQVLADHKDYCGSLSGFTQQSEFVLPKLSHDAVYSFMTLPIDIQRELLMERDPHGNVVVSQIETEKLLIELVVAFLAEEKAEGRFHGTFGHQHHFLGYEGRCAAPSNFDADYAYALGRSAAALAGAGVTGYMAVVAGLARPRSEWQAFGAPLAAMMTLETRGGHVRPVIRKCLVSLNGRAFRHFAAHRATWALGEHYRFAGPIQYFGPEALTDAPPFSLVLENERPLTGV